LKNNILKYKKIQYIKNYFNSLLDFIAPAHCIVCKKYYNYEIKKSKFICNACYDNLNFAIEKELILNKILQNFPQDKCFISEATSLISLKNNINYLEIIHSFKYLRFQSIGIEFSKLLSQRIIYDNMQNYDYIVPIPIHFAKNRERGFNQSDIIAKTISNELNLKFADNILYRNKYTITQTLLSKSERIKNVENVFSIKNNADIYNKSLLLIDDVLTTGSTLNNAAEILVKYGASRVGAATILFAH